MVSDEELAGLDPVDLMDREAAWIEEHYNQLPAADWLAPSRCAGWTSRDVLAHLAASERYHHACLDGRVTELMNEMAERGATDFATFNAFGIADFAAVPDDELLRTWISADADTRQRFRERSDGEVDSSIGLYPARWQAFHLAGELATHADDVAVSIPETDRAARRDWRARFSRFSLREAKPDLTVDLAGARTRVVGGEIDVVLDDDDLIAAVAGRAESTQLDADVRKLLSTIP